MGSVALVVSRMNLARSTDRLFTSFRRVTSTGLLIPEIDGLRFVAILAVFIYHLAGDVLRHADQPYRLAVAQNGWFFQFTQRLDFGVPLFFVISGFILALPFGQQYLKNQTSVSLPKY